MTYIIDMGKMLLGIFIIVFVIGLVIKMFAYAMAALLVISGLIAAAMFCYAGLLIGDAIVGLFKK